jgi:hypothetical protein
MLAKEKATETINNARTGDLLTPQERTVLRPAQIKTDQPELDEDETRGVSWSNRGNARPLMRTGSATVALP